MNRIKINRIGYVTLKGLCPYFQANNIKKDSKKQSILLSSVGAETYKVIKSLEIPNNPAEKSFKEIMDFPKEHQVNKPNKTAERFKLNMKAKKYGESLSEYLAEFHRLR